MKSEEITIRFAAAEDAQGLAALSMETFHDAFSGHPLMPTADLSAYLNEAFTLQQITRELMDPKTIFLLADIDGEAAGYAKLVMGAKGEGVTAHNPVKLQRLYSKQKFIGAGLGTALLEQCLAEAQGRGHDTIWLSVWEHNLRAQRFYHKWHFEPCGFIDFRLGQSVMKDLVMQLRLSQNAVTRAGGGICLGLSQSSKDGFKR